MAQNTLSVAQFLFDPELSEGRGYMFEDLGRKPVSKWTDEDKAKAQRVCSSYDIAGLLVMAGIVDRDVIVQHWGQTLKRLYPIMKPLISNRRELSGDPYYWQSLEWLAKQVDD
jgi:hypothetical protein